MARFTSTIGRASQPCTSVGLYVVVVTLCCIVSCQAELITTPGFAFNAYDEAEMSCMSLSGTPKLIWLKQGVQIQNTTGKYSISADGVLKVLHVDEPDVGPLYVCKDISTSPPQQANVTLNGVAVVNMSSTQNISQGQDLVLNCKTWGYPVPGIIWYYKGQAIKGSQYQISNSQTPHNGYTLVGGKLTVRNAQTTDSGAYTCNAQNTFGDYNGTTHVYVTGSQTPPIKTESTSTPLTAVPLLYRGTFRVTNQPYKSSLANTASSDFTALNATLYPLLRKTYAESLTPDVFVGISQIAFSNGSLVVTNDFSLRANLSDFMLATSVNSVLFTNLRAINFTMDSSTFGPLPNMPASTSSTVPVCRLSAAAIAISILLLLLGV